MSQGEIFIFMKISLFDSGIAMKYRQIEII